MGAKPLTVITIVGLGIIGLVIWVWHTGSGPAGLACPCGARSAMQWAAL